MVIVDIAKITIWLYRRQSLSLWLTEGGGSLIVVPICTHAIFAEFHYFHQSMFFSLSFYNPRTFQEDLGISPLFAQKVLNPFLIHKVSLFLTIVREINYQRWKCLPPSGKLWKVYLTIFEYCDSLISASFPIKFKILKMRLSDQASKLLISWGHGAGNQ